jgi:hypothetical protein
MIRLVLLVVVLFFGSLVAQGQTKGLEEKAVWSVNGCMVLSKRLYTVKIIDQYISSVKADGMEGRPVVIRFYEEGLVNTVSSLTVPEGMVTFVSVAEESEERVVVDWSQTKTPILPSRMFTDWIRSNQYIKVSVYVVDIPD